MTRGEFHVIIGNREPLRKFFSGFAPQHGGMIRAHSHVANCTKFLDSKALANRKDVCRAEPHPGTVMA